MNLSKLAVKRPVTTMMMVLVVVLLGLISLSGLPIDLMPEIEIPVAIVMTSYSGAGPQEVENLVTDRVEDALATVSNIDSINSISSEGNSIVIAQFNTGTDMDFATLEMREKVDLVKGALPDDTTEPMVLKLDPNSMPIIQIAISSDVDLGGLQSLAEDELEQRFERIEGVASVSIGGGVEEEIEILVDQKSLSTYGLNINGLSQLISSSNINLPAGTVKKGREELSVRAVGEFKNIEELRDIPITLPTGQVILLRDIADVNLVNKEIKSISRAKGVNSLNMSMQKQSGSNTVKVADSINKEVESIKEEYPHINIEVVFDSSTMVTDSINNVVNNVLIGGLFAVLVLYIFLKSIRTTLIVGVSIPISLIASFILLYFNGITLNMMTLGGLALAVGMLVDSAIVVLENIYRYSKEGYSKEAAAIEGAGEVGMAIVASTLTTIAVFLPIVFIDGMVGIIFKDFALTVALSLGASLLVALTLIPMLSSKMISVDLDEDKNKKKKKLDFIYRAFDSGLERVEERYRSLLTWGISHRKSVMLMAGIIFVTSMFSLVSVGMEFFPSMDEGSISIGLKLPLGSSIHEVNEIAEVIEGEIEKIEEVDLSFTSIGSSNNLASSASSNTGTININLVKIKERKRSTTEVTEEIREMVKDIPGAEISVEESSMGIGGGMGSGEPISIKVKGNNLDILEEISDDFKDIVESVEGTREVKTSLGDAVSELEVLVNKENAAAYGLTTGQIISSVRGGVTGNTITTLKVDGDETDIVMRVSGDYKEKLSDFEEMEIISPAGEIIPLSQLADISIIKAPVQISRENQERVVTVSSQIVGRDLGSVNGDIESKLKGYEFPDGYYYEVGGENEDMMEAFGQLVLALGLAIILIYMVMASQFESLVHPFIILFTIPLAFAGGALGLFITRTPMGVTAFIGVIMLSGIVVNNGIVLVDYINTLRREGKEMKEAIVIAGPIRLRPILMTTLTTVLGLIPLALGIGEGAETQAPMAIVVIGGLTLSTVLTLVFVPTLYTIIEDMSSKVKSKFNERFGELLGNKRDIVVEDEVE